MDEELTTDGALLMIALPSATAEKALQIRQATAQASKRPEALNVLAQGLHAQGSDRPTAHGGLASRGKRNGRCDRLSKAMSLPPLLDGLSEHLTSAGHFWLHQGPGQQQSQNRGLRPSRPSCHATEPA